MNEKTLSPAEVKRICRAFNETYDSLVTLSVNLIRASTTIKRLGDALKENFPDEFSTAPEKGGNS